MAHYVGDALSEIKKIQGDANGLDYSTLPAFAKRTVIENGKPVEVRDMGAMLTMLTVAVQQLTERIEKLESKAH